ncbi:type II toxin-antitoxin system mRNA interferase toxin, RelE/StbE family [Candidatus Gracilibacteria bacterium]|nr:type II toxin-antitoxin system mRNA interferase toxin, RelE/StbE family [Candidatus Gracilibacteria bacterium]
MKIREIHVHKSFEKQFKALPAHIQQKAVKTDNLFRANPFHPSLRLHKLKGKLGGLWSISIDREYRIIFEVFEDGNVLFISIGRHSIYE